ncbi:MAG: hypothetical protein ACM3KM_04060 [Acidobacteriaceae bacterium]
MDAQHIFYIVASVVLILLGIALLIFFFISIALLKMLRTVQSFLEEGKDRLDKVARDISDYFAFRTKTWGATTAITTIFRLMSKIIFGRS